MHIIQQIGRQYTRIKHSTTISPAFQSSFSGRVCHLHSLEMSDLNCHLTVKALWRQNNQFEEKRILLRIEPCYVGGTYIEWTLRGLVDNWRIFHRVLNTDLSFSEETVKTCCVYTTLFEIGTAVEWRKQGTLSIEGLFDMDPSVEEPTTKKATKWKYKFADYLVSQEDSLRWHLTVGTYLSERAAAVGYGVKV